MTFNGLLKKKNRINEFLWMINAKEVPTSVWAQYLTALKYAINKTKRLEVLVKEGVNHPDIEDKNNDEETNERITGWLHGSWLVLILAGALFYTTVTFSFFSVPKYSTLSTKLPIILAKCTLVHKKRVFLPLKMKAKPNCTPPYLLPLTNPLCMVVCDLCSGWALVHGILHLNGGKVLAWMRWSTLQNG